MKLADLFKEKKFYIGILVLFLGIFATTVSGTIITVSFKPPVLQDFILNSIIFLKIGWVYDLFAIVITILLTLYSFTKEQRKVPYFMVLFGILYFLRAIFIVLTPLGNPGLNNNPLLTGETFLAGLYFSGHTAEAFLAFLISKGKMRIIFLVLLFVIIFSLLVARGHYSIDILSGIVFAYAIYCFGEKNLKKQLIVKEQ